MTVWPATASVPVRAVPVVFAATPNVTAPMPEPVAPAVTVIHGVVVFAVHAQDVPEVTLSVRLLASASTAKLAGVTVAAQPVAPSTASRSGSRQSTCRCARRRSCWLRR